MAKSRKEIEHRQRRKYILECAEKLFAEKGLDGVTVADIAKASEFSVGSIYLFFESKEELIKHLLLERVNQIAYIVSTEVEKDLPALEKLENTIDGVLDMFIKHMDYFKLYVMEIKGSELCKTHAEHREDFFRIMDKFFEDFTSIFRQGIEEGVFKDNIEPLHMTFFLEASLHSIVEYIIRSGEDIPLDKIREGMQEMLYHGIFKRGRGKKK